MRATTNFSKVEVKKPINEPKEAFKARFGLELSQIISPINAPINGPIIIPKGGKNTIPNTNPIVVPATPQLEPPNFLVPIAGIR